MTEARQSSRHFLETVWQDVRRDEALMGGSTDVYRRQRQYVSEELEKAAATLAEAGKTPLVICRRRGSSGDHRAWRM